MSMTLPQLKAALSIVRSRIDDELEMQPEYYWHAAEGWALAQSRRDGLTAQLKETDATIYKELKVPGADTKVPSDEKILKEVTLDVRHTSLEKRIREAQHEVNLWAGMVEAFNKRNAMLSRLSEMMMGGLLQRDSVQGSRQDIDKARKALAAARGLASAAAAEEAPVAAALTRTRLVD